jgi:hypothetical protein
MRFLFRTLFFVAASVALGVVVWWLAWRYAK